MEPSIKAQKVVIVEDNVSLADIYKIRLEILGYQCFAAYDGKEALEIIEREIPDLVLLDLMVPKVAGDQILEIMRAHEWGKSIKVLVISNLNEADAPAGLRQNGIVGYAVKANLSNDQLDRLVDDILKPSDQEESMELEAPEVRMSTSPLTTIASVKDLIITRVINAPLGRVWDAWTNAVVLQQWWGPDNYSCPSAKLNVYNGGTSVISIKASDQYGGKISYGSLAYTAVIPQQILEFIHNLSDESGQRIDPATIGMPADFPQGQRHEIMFKSMSATQTEITVIEHDWPIGQMRDMSQLGMEQSLTKLETVLNA